VSGGLLIHPGRPPSWRAGAPPLLQLRAAPAPPPTCSPPPILVAGTPQSVVIFGFPFVPDYIWSVPPLTVIFALMPWAPLAKAAGACSRAACAQPG
jgi:hypothetical protein